LNIEARTSGGDLAFVGKFTPAPFVDLWKRSTTGGGAGAFGAMYQSTLTDIVWGDVADSEFLVQLRAAAAGGALSIKFNVDGCDLNSASPTFTWGRVAGTISVHRSGEPHHFVASRILQGPSNVPALLSENRLTVDLGNRLPTTSPGGSLQDLGTLQIVAMLTPPIVLGSVDSATLYDNDAGVVDLSLTSDQYDVATAHLIRVVDASGEILAEERADGSFLRADDFVFRLYPGEGTDTASTVLYASTFGRPAAGVEISVALDEAAMAGNEPEMGVPAAALEFPSSVRTGADGRATLTLRAHNPGNPRGFIDGQICLVAYGWTGDPDPAAGNELSVLVWDTYNAPPTVTWVDDIHPILQQYANLYPVMRSFLDLSSYHSVVKHRFPLQLSLGLPIEDPNTMPVTRDLSPGKRKAILDWLTQREPALYRADDVESLRQMVQAAIEIEDSTIPVYLTALFSIKPGANLEVAGIIRSIVIQEMLHLTLVGNLLNAIGGAPRIGEPGFVPTYPGHLPGSVRPDFVVTLRKCSIAQIRDVFMAIEQPNRPLTTRPDALISLDLSKVQVLDTGDVDISGPEEFLQDLTASFEDVENDPYTIGWFYDQIARSIIRLDHHGSLFTGDPDHQLTPAHWPGAPGRLYRITDKTSALLAIHQITREGEGTSHTDPIGDPHQLAHYYRFQEIVE
jgi:Ferritin-like